MAHQPSQTLGLSQNLLRATLPRVGPSPSQIASAVVRLVHLTTRRTQRVAKRTAHVAAAFALLSLWADAMICVARSPYHAKEGFAVHVEQLLDRELWLPRYDHARFAVVRRALQLFQHYTPIFGVPLLVDPLHAPNCELIDVACAFPARLGCATNGRDVWIDDQGRLCANGYEGLPPFKHPCGVWPYLFTQQTWPFLTVWELVSEHRVSELVVVQRYRRQQQGFAKPMPPVRQRFRSFESQRGRVIALFRGDEVEIGCVGERHSGVLPRSIFDRLVSAGQMQKYDPAAFTLSTMCSPEEIRAINGDHTLRILTYHLAAVVSAYRSTPLTEVGAHHYEAIVSDHEYDPESKEMLAASCPPFIDGRMVPYNCRNNTRHAVDSRIVGVRSAVSDVPADLGSYADEFSALLMAECVTLHGGPLTPCDDEQVLDAQSRPNQQRLLDEARNRASDKPRMQAMFLKAESYDSTKDPRIITPSDPLMQLEGTRYLKLFSELLYKLPWCGFGKPGKKIARRVVNILGEASTATNTDFSRFDGTISPACRLLEERIVLPLFAPEHKEEAQKWLRRMHDVRVRDPFNRFKYNTRSARSSGAPDTSCFNTLLNAFVAYAMIRRSRPHLSPQQAYGRIGIYGGDDGLTADPDPRAYLSVASSLGLRLEVELITRDQGEHPEGLKHTVKFLGRIYGPGAWHGDVNSMSEPRKCLGTWHLGRKNISAAENLTRKAYSRLYLDNETPVLGDVAQKIIDLAGIPHPAVQQWDGADSDNWLVKQQLEWGWDKRYPNFAADWMISVIEWSIPELDCDRFLEAVSRCNSLDDIMSGCLGTAGEYFVKTGFVLNREIWVDQGPSGQDPVCAHDDSDSKQELEHKHSSPREDEHESKNQAREEQHPAEQQPPRRGSQGSPSQRQRVRKQRAKSLPDLGLPSSGLGHVPHERADPEVSQRHSADPGDCSASPSGPIQCPAAAESTESGGHVVVRDGDVLQHGSLPMAAGDCGVPDRGTRRGQDTDHVEEGGASTQQRIGAQFRVLPYGLYGLSRDEHSKSHGAWRHHLLQYVSFLRRQRSSAYPVFGPGKGSQRDVHFGSGFLPYGGDSSKLDAYQRLLNPGLVRVVCNSNWAQLPAPSDDSGGLANRLRSAPGGQLVVHANGGDGDEHRDDPVPRNRDPVRKKGCRRGRRGRGGGVSHGEQASGGKQSVGKPDPPAGQGGSSQPDRRASETANQERSQAPAPRGKADPGSGKPSRRSARRPSGPRKAGVPAVPSSSESKKGRSDESGGKGAAKSAQRREKQRANRTAAQFGVAGRLLPSLLNAALVFRYDESQMWPDMFVAKYGSSTDGHGMPRTIHVRTVEPDELGYHDYLVVATRQPDLRHAEPVVKPQELFGGNKIPDGWQHLSFRCVLSGLGSTPSQRTSSPANTFLDIHSKKRKQRHSSWQKISTPKPAQQPKQLPKLQTDWRRKLAGMGMELTDSSDPVEAIAEVCGLSYGEARHMSQQEAMRRYNRMTVARRAKPRVPARGPAPGPSPQGDNAPD